MKVDELKQKLNGYDKATIMKLAVEFYKLIPKAKKEDEILDNLINEPNAPKVTNKSSKIASIQELAAHIELFLSHVKSNYYTEFNKVVPKSERPKWRFMVKNFYKDLLALKLSEESDKVIRASLMQKLYDIMCDGLRNYHFNSDDTFISVGITQPDFYRTTLQLIDDAEGKVSVIHKGIPLIIEHTVNREILPDTLMCEFIEIVNTPDARYSALEKIENYIKDIQATLVPPNSKKHSMWDTSEYRKKDKINNLAKLGMRIHIALFEYSEAIHFFKTYHLYESDKEIKHYILIRILLEYRLKDVIKKEIEQAIEEGIKPRESLMKLLNHIKQKGELPQYMS